jgi:hypothetical protein
MTRPADGRILVIPGLPNFNDSDEAFKVTRFEGWFDTAEPDAVLAPNGGRAGSVATGPWLPKQRVYTLAGRIQVPRAELAEYRRLLLAALPAERDVTITNLGNGLDIDLEASVRRYGAPTITLGAQLDFVFPLVAADPYRYKPLSGDTAATVGVNTGSSWSKSFVRSGAVWGTQFVKVDGVWGWQFQRIAAASAYPLQATLTSDGTAASHRVTVSVTGPLTAGSWSLSQEYPAGVAHLSQRLQVSVAAGQTLVIDNYAQTATLAGGDVTRYVFGDWLTFEPGVNVYKLNAGVASDAYATITAQEAHQ